jgi:hypothetical protein
LGDRGDQTLIIKFQRRDVEFWVCHFESLAHKIRCYSPI